MRAVHKRYLREFIPPMSVYVTLNLATIVWLGDAFKTTSLRALVTILPVVPIAFVLRAMVRVVRDQDELERRIDLESGAIAGGMVGFGYFTYGFLLKASLLPAPSAAAVAMLVLPLLWGCFGLVKAAVRLRYRDR